MILKPKYTVRCPKCRALPGRQCITSGGNRTATAHVQRKQAQHRQDYLVRTALKQWEALKQQARG